MHRYDVDEGGAQFLGYAKQLLAKLKAWMNTVGLDSAHRNVKTPDGDGDIFIKTRRLGGESSHEYSYIQDTTDWDDYVRITSGSRYFVIRPYIRRLSSTTPILLPVASRFAKIPFNKNEVSAVPFAPTTGWQDLPQRDVDNAKGLTVTGFMSSTSSIPSGVVKGKLTDVNGGSIGQDTFRIRRLFKHDYVDPGTSANVSTYAYATNPSVGSFGIGITFLDGLGATVYSGPALNQISHPVTYSVSKDGRTLVACGPGRDTLVNAAAVYRLDVDRGAATDVVGTNLSDPVPLYSGLFAYTTSVLAITPDYGLGFPVGQPPNEPWTYSKTQTRYQDLDQTFTIAKGVDTDGNLIDITGRLFVDQDYSFVFNAAADYTPISTPPGTHLGDASAHISQTFVQNLTITMPGGQKILPLNDTSLISGTANGVSPFCGTYVQDQTGEYLTTGTPPMWSTTLTGTGSATTTETVGQLEIIYCDPAVPVLLYQYTHGTVTRTYTLSGSWTSWSNGAISGTLTRDLVLWFGDTETVLLSESRPASSVVMSVTSPAFDAGVTSGTYTATSPSFTGHYVNRLTWQVTPKRVTQPTSGYTITVDIRSKRDWLISIYRPTDYNGVTVKDLTFYSAKHDPAALKTKYLDYLKTVLAGDPANGIPVVDATAAADIAAGTLSNYEIRMTGGILRFSPASPASYTASLIAQYEEYLGTYV